MSILSARNFLTYAMRQADSRRQHRRREARTAQLVSPFAPTAREMVMEQREADAIRDGFPDGGRHNE